MGVGKMVRTIRLKHPHIYILIGIITVLMTLGGLEKIMAKNSKSEENVSKGKIIFSSVRKQKFCIYVMNADGTGQKQLIENAGSPSWSPDGTKIAFAKDGGIWIANADGTDQRKIISSPGETSWSPNGAKIAFTSGREQVKMSEPNDQIYILDLKTGEEKRLLPTNLKIESSQPTWSPDGKKIAFVSIVSYPPIKGKTYTGAETIVLQDFPQIFVIDLEKKVVKQLTYDEETPAESPAWSPDGTKIVFATRRDGRIWVMNTDGTEQKQVTKKRNLFETRYDMTPCWSPDGKQIAFATIQSGRPFNGAEIHVINVDGTNERALTKYRGGDDDDRWPDWWAPKE